MLKKHLIIGLITAALPLGALAQMGGSMYGPEQGDWEITLGGAGTSDEDLDNADIGANGSLGYFVTDNVEVAVRQGARWVDDADDQFSTFGAVDYHFDLDRVQPFVGANFGGFYGATDTWGAGLEAGVKYYVKPKTFVYGSLQYAWTFKDADDADDAFDNGGFIYGLGIGFNF